MKKRIKCSFCGSEAKEIYKYQWTSIFECSNNICSMMFAFPKLSGDELDGYYNRLYYLEKGNQGKYLPTPEEVIRQKIRHMRDLYGYHKKGKLLDFGAGTGIGVKIAGEMGFETAGLETNDNARGVAGSLNRGSIIYKNFKELMEIKKGFDVIFMNDVIEHVQNPEEILNGLREMLNDDGFLYVSTMNNKSLKAFILRGKWEYYTNPTHLFYFNADSLKNMLIRTGYKEIALLKNKIFYAHHGFFRNILQIILQEFHIDSGLRIVARK